MIGKKSWIRKIYLMIYIWWYRDNLVYTSERNTYTINDCILIKTFYNKSSYHGQDIKDYANIYLYWDKEMGDCLWKGKLSEGLKILLKEQAEKQDLNWLSLHLFKKYKGEKGKVCPIETLI